MAASCNSGRGVARGRRAYDANGLDNPIQTNGTRPLNRNTYVGRTPLPRTTGNHIISWQAFAAVFARGCHAKARRQRRPARDPTHTSLSRREIEPTVFLPELTEPTLDRGNSPGVAREVCPFPWSCATLGLFAARPSVIESPKTNTVVRKTSRKMSKKTPKTATTFFWPTTFQTTFQTTFEFNSGLTIRTQK